jgi:hypothetical protein
LPKWKFFLTVPLFENPDRKKPSMTESGFSWFVVAGQFVPAMLVYQKKNRMEAIKESTSIIEENTKKRYYHVGIYG